MEDGELKVGSADLRVSVYNQYECTRTCTLLVLILVEEGMMMEVTSTHTVRVLFLFVDLTYTYTVRMDDNGVITRARTYEMTKLFVFKRLQ